MTADDLLPLLDGVRRSGNGWVARCPGHADRNPSLSVKEGDRGLLVRCFAGCSVSEIVDAIGIKVNDLFYDSDRRIPDLGARREAGRRREIERAAQRRAEGNLAHRRREAEELIEAAKRIDISTRDDGTLDRALDALGDAYRVLEDERIEEDARAAMLAFGMSAQEIEGVIHATPLPLLSRRIGLIAEGGFDAEMARAYLLLRNEKEVGT